MSEGDGMREDSERAVFETLVTQQGSPMVMSVVTSMADGMTQVGAGITAMIGIITGGCSALVMRDEPGAVLDQDHQWLFTFAASEEALRAIAESLIETADYIKEHGGPHLIRTDIESIDERPDRPAPAIEAAGAEASDGDGGVGEVDDDGQG